MLFFLCFHSCPATVFNFNHTSHRSMPYSYIDDFGCSKCSSLLFACVHEPKNDLHSYCLSECFLKLYTAIKLSIFVQSMIYANVCSLVVNSHASIVYSLAAIMVMYYVTNQVLRMNNYNRKAFNLLQQRSGLEIVWMTMLPFIRANTRIKLRINSNLLCFSFNRQV